MTGWSVYAIRYATQVERRPARLTFLGGKEGETFEGLDYFFWVLRRDGEVVLIDTGLSKEMCTAFGRRWLAEPVELLAKLGIAASSITRVILTHAHADHVGNLDKFPNATFFIQEDEMGAIAGVGMTHEFFRHPYSLDCTKALIGLLYEGRVKLLEGNGCFSPGIDYYQIGGHARGQMALRIASCRGDLVLASDAIHYYSEFEDERPFFAFDDIKKMILGYRTCKRLAGSAEFLIPGHDPTVTRSYPAAVADLEGLILHLSVPPTVPGWALPT